MALVGGCANDRARPKAGSALARVGLRARVSIVARAAVRLQRVRPGPRRRVAAATAVALVAWRTNHRYARAGAIVARVASGAGIAIIARGPGERGIRADAGGRIARPGPVALVKRRAEHGIGSDAGAALARVDLGAGVAVVAGSAVAFWRVGAGAGGRIAGA